MTKVHLYIHDLTGGIYNEYDEDLSRLPKVGDFIKLDETLHPYRVDAVVDHGTSLASVYVTRDTHGICLRGHRGTVGTNLEVYLTGVAA